VPSDISGRGRWSFQRRYDATGWAEASRARQLAELVNGCSSRINGGRPTPRQEIENDVLPTFLDYYERFPGYGFWAAVEKSTGRFVGWFHFRPAERAHPDEIELGYRLRKSAWGKGYATEGSRALIQKGFAELGV
jgi:RimJ/RimL family protein N-acetyltransferase